MSDNDYVYHSSNSFVFGDSYPSQNPGPVSLNSIGKQILAKFLFLDTASCLLLHKTSYTPEVFLRVEYCGNHGYNDCDNIYTYI